MKETKEVKNPAALLEMETIFNTFYLPKIEQLNPDSNIPGKYLQIKEVATKGIAGEHKLMSLVEDNLKHIINNDEVLLIFGLLDAVHNDTKNINFTKETAVRFLGNCLNDKTAHKDAAILVMEIYVEHGGKIKDLMAAFQTKYLPEEAAKDEGLSAQKYFATQVFDSKHANFRYSTLDKFLFLLYPEDKDQVNYMRTIKHYLIHPDNHFIKDLKKPLTVENPTQKIVRFTLKPTVINDIYNNYYEPHFIKIIPIPHGHYRQRILKHPCENSNQALHLTMHLDTDMVRKSANSL